MSSPNLFRIYELSDQLAQLLEAFEANPEAAPESLQAGLDALTGEFNERVEDVALAIQNAKARKAALMSECDRLSSLAARESDTENKLKGALLLLMNKATVKKVKGKLVTISVANNGGVLPVKLTCDPKDLPENFRKVEYTLNRAEVDKALAVGMDLPDGITVEERGQHIRIS